MLNLALLLRPHDKLVGLNVLPLSLLFLFFDTPTQIFQRAERSPVRTQKYITGLVLGWTPKFTQKGGEKCIILHKFPTPVAFDALWLQNGAMYVKSNNTSTLSYDDRPSFWPIHFSHPSPSFYRGSNISKFGLIFTALQYAAGPSDRGGVRPSAGPD